MKAAYVLMKNITVSVFPDREAGSMRKIAGVNNSTTIYHAPSTPTEKPLFDALGVSFVRYHDAAIENPGYSLVDISRLFPVFRLDENDPANYDFGATDEYLALLPDKEIVIDFRLGETIEHSAVKHRVITPSDFEKWARICINILRHYKKGWADGFFMENLRYASIWEEPDNGALYTAGYESYLTLFVTAFPIIKREFPGLLLGGPNVMDFDVSRCERFLAVCAENGVRPDFLSGTMYRNRTGDFADRVREIRTLCEKYGMPDLEIILSEWHKAPDSWTAHTDNGFDRAPHAAFTASALIKLLDTDVTAAYYYAWRTGSWALLKLDVTGELKPLPVYYGIRYFTELTDCEKRISCKADDMATDVLAGISGDTVKLLVARYDGEPCSFTLQIPGFTHGTVRSIPEGMGRKAEIRRPVTADCDGLFRTEGSESGSATLLFEFTKG